jgi:inorganic triphosphatase YgiF
MAAADSRALPTEPEASRLGLEVELKFLARGSGPLRLLARRARLGAAQLGAPHTTHEIDRYLETLDGRFRAAGWACRLRRVGGRTRLSLKGRASEVSSGAAGTALHRRRELEGDAELNVAPDRWPDSEARQVLLDIAAGAPLTDLVVLDQRRTQRDVIVSGASVGFLSLDRVEVRHAEALVGRLGCVELEFSGGAPPQSLSEALERALRTVPGLEPDPFSKLEHAEALVAAGTSERG